MLRDADFKMVYSTGEEDPVSFYIEGLMESNHLDLGLGFFSSSGFRVLSYGFAYFLNRGGTMRLLINNILTPADKEAIEKGLKSSPKQIAEDNLYNDIISLHRTLSKQDRHFFNCLSWLISTKKLSIAAIVPKNNSYGLAHQKFGIFSDKASDKVAFNGSLNFSETAFIYNLETIDCFRSWTEEKERVKYYETLFRKTWTGQNEAVEFLPIERIKTAISNSFPISDIEELLKFELELIKGRFNDNVNDLTRAKLSKLQHGLIEKISHNDTSVANKWMPREYQEKAISNWQMSNYNGFFEMATGTGKTLTGLFASLTLKEVLGKCFLLVLVPTITLAEQWKEEVQKVGYRNFFIVSSEYPNWGKELINGLNDIKLNVVDHIVCICTYDSYKLDRFQTELIKFPKETLLIADEAHAMGAPQTLNNLPFNIQYRLGLSATPHRHFDDSGTKKLLNFFNCEIEPSYKLDLKEAIKMGFLCQYKLHPHLAELNESEYADYVEITSKIAKRAHVTSSTFEDSDPQLDKLLRDRRNILNRAEAKLQILGNIIDSIIETEGEIKHTLVYCPEGNDAQEDSKIIDKYGRFLGMEKGLKIGKFIGETPLHERNRLLEEFDSGEIQCLLAMKCLDEGVDIKQTKIAIFLSSSTNPRQYVQRRGRVLRTHTKKSFAHLHDILAVPPEILTDEQTLRIDKIIINQELNRYREFAEDALNYVQAIEPIKPILKKYELVI